MVIVLQVVMTVVFGVLYNSNSLPKTSQEWTRNDHHSSQSVNENGQASLHYFTLGIWY